MIKKRLVDGSECRKCADATDHLKSRGLWDRIDDIVWAHDANPESAGHIAGQRLGVDRAPFFVVREDDRELVYTSVLQLVRDKLGTAVTDEEHAAAIDVDDIGGI
jgi:hypothetical protein